MAGTFSNKRMLVKQGKFEQARLSIERAIDLSSYLRTIQPRAYSDFYSNLAFIDLKQDRLEDAAAHYKMSLDVFENFALTHFRLADTLIKLGKVDEAKAHLRRAFEIAEIKKNDKLAADILHMLDSLNEKK